MELSRVDKEIKEICARLYAKAKEKYTGKLVFEITFSDGGIRQMKSVSEEVILPKKS